MRLYQFYIVYTYIIGDDERLCNRLPCPHNCTCRGFGVDCRHSNQHIIPTSFRNNTIRILDLSHNILIDSNLDYFHSYTDLVMLYMVNCSITGIQGNFTRSIMLKHIDLSYNAINHLDSDVFRRLNMLQKLILKYNKLKIIGSLFSIKQTFNLYTLTHIDLSVSEITYLLPKSFSACPLLMHLNLSHNPFIFLPAELFDQSNEYQYIDIIGVSLQTIHWTNIYSIHHVEVINGEIPELCCLSRSIDDCRVKKSSVSSCEHLISSPVMQIFIWINGLTITVLNASVILYRISTKKIYRKWTTYTNIYIINMALSDLMMGVYVLFLAIQDTTYAGIYASVSWTWRMSGVCRMLGVLSTIASELSLLTLLLLTSFQYATIQRVYGTVLHVKVYVTLSIISAWVLVVILSVIPILELSYFGGTFVSDTGTCSLYKLSTGRNVARGYTISVWLVGNLIILCAMTGLQVGLGIKIYKSSSRVAGRRIMRSMNTNTLFAIFVVVAFLCWTPIVTTLWLVNIDVHVSQVVMEYIVILLLPFNALVNPIIYTARIALVKKQSCCC